MAAYETLDTFSVRDAIRAVWLNLVVSNFENHEERLVDLEDQIGLDASALAAGFYVATQELTDAQVKALPTTGISIIAAPDANQRVKLHGVTYTCWFQNGAYTNVDADDCTLELQTPSGARLGGFLANDSGDSLATMTTVFASASVLVIDVGPYATNAAGAYIQPLVTTAPGSLAGQGVQLKATNNGAGNFTGGHTSNRLTVQVYYSLESTQTYQMPFSPLLVPRAHRAGDRPRVDGSMPTTLR